MASQVGFTLSTSRTGSAQGLQMVLLIELESSKIVAKVLEARFSLYPLQTVGQKQSLSWPRWKVIGILNKCPGWLHLNKRAPTIRILSSQPARELPSWTVTGYKRSRQLKRPTAWEMWLDGPACPVSMGQSNQCGGGWAARSIPAHSWAVSVFHTFYWVLFYF